MGRTPAHQPVGGAQACTLLAGLLAAAVIAFDEQLGASGRHLPWTFQGGADSARTVLSTIAGSMITVAGTIYSLTIVVLTLASVQFAPRVLRAFMRDRGNQTVLGFFVATFTYCLVVLRVIRGPGGDEFVPANAVTGGLLLALISVGMLIYFIDHIFHSIEVSNILATVARETARHIDQLYPQLWDAQADQGVAAPPAADWVPVPATRTGYLQYVDTAALLALATRHDLILWQDRHIGAFFSAGTPLLYAAPAPRGTPALTADLNAAFALGRAPTLQQDVAYGFRQIVDIALKAISPAVNDPTTAENCIDYLGALLLHLARRRIPQLDLRDAGGQVRVYLAERSFHDLVRLAVDQIRHYGAGDHVIGIRLLDTLGRVAAGTENPAYRAALQEYVDRIAASAARSIGDPDELRVVQEHAAAARTVCGDARGGCPPPTAPPV